jgi:uncharacterized protein YdaU (DUF1376 family)
MATPRKAKAPAFQFYANDFLTGTQTMTLAARGAYITLLCQQWDKGGLSFDVESIARLLSCERGEARAILGQVSGKFRAGSDGLFRNDRIEKERVKQRRFRQKQAQNGKKGGRPKNNPGLSFGFHLGKPKHKPKKSPSSSSSEVRTPPIGSPRGTARMAKADPWRQQEKTAEMQRLMAGGMSRLAAEQRAFGKEN